MEFTLKGNRIALLGKTKSGKSQLLKYMLEKEKNKFNKIYVISPTNNLTNYYNNLIPSNQIMNQYSDDWIKSLIDKLTEYKVNNKGKEYNVLLILDDVGSDENFIHAKNLNNIFVRGRHIFISCIICLQYLYQIPPIIRCQLSYVCCSQMNPLAEKSLLEEFKMGNISNKDFLELYHENCKDYNFFVINCNSVINNNDINEIYGSIRAEN